MAKSLAIPVCVTLYIGTPSPPPIIQDAQQTWSVITQIIAKGHNSYWNLQ